MKIEIRKILCPVDFSETSLHASQYAVALADAFSAELLLTEVKELYVPAPSEYPDMPWLVPDLQEPPGQPDDQRLEKLAADLRKNHSCRILTRQVSGKPFLEIIRHARDENVSLIVMGTHGRTGLSHILIGSVTERVVRLAPCPVLTVKHPEHEFIAVSP